MNRPFPWQQQILDAVQKHANLRIVCVCAGRCAGKTELGRQLAMQADASGRSPILVLPNARMQEYTLRHVQFVPPLNRYQALNAESYKGMFKGFSEYTTFILDNAEMLKWEFVEPLFYRAGKLIFVGTPPVYAVKPNVPHWFLDQWRQAKRKEYEGVRAAFVARSGENPLVESEHAITQLYGSPATRLRQIGVPVFSRLSTPEAIWVRTAGRRRIRENSGAK